MGIEKKPQRQRQEKRTLRPSEAPVEASGERSKGPASCTPRRPRTCLGSSSSPHGEEPPLTIPWMDEILHQNETMGNHCLLVLTGDTFLGGAGFCPSTVRVLLGKRRMNSSWSMIIYTYPVACKCTAIPFVHSTNGCS